MLLPASGLKCPGAADRIKADQGWRVASRAASIRHRLQPDRIHRRSVHGSRDNPRGRHPRRLVVILLQTWRASIIPIVAIGVVDRTFAVLADGLSLNNLSLFGLVLAIGIVVDDAIVVVENVERNLRLGISPKRGGAPDDGEVGGALIAIALVLSAVLFLRPLSLASRANSSASRDHDRFGDDHFVPLFADLEPGALRSALQAASGARGPRIGADSSVTAFSAGFNYAFDKVSAGYGD